MAAINLKALVDGLHPLEIRLLRALDAHPGADEATLAEAGGLGAAQFRRAAEWLLTKELVAVSDEARAQVVRATELGESFAEGGLPEDRIVEALKTRGEIPMAEFKSLEGLNPQDTFSAIGQLKNRGVMVVDQGKARIAPDADLAFAGRATEVLRRVIGGDAVLVDELDDGVRDRVLDGVHKKFRAKGFFWIENRVTRNLALTEQGGAVAAEVERRGLTGEDLSRLTPQMLEDGSWRGKSFRRYNIELAPPRTLAARKHPYRTFVDYVKYKLIAMGFEEMTGPLVESEFWNMDALFMPQFHSARDIQDVYFVKEPTRYTETPEGVKDLDDAKVERVARTHECGGDAGSRGWSYAFDRERTRRLVLRSQGTALSARTLASNPKIPGKYFAMARCFRYDTVDATHGCDFMQTEGIVLGEDINFRTLLGLLKLFAVEVAKADPEEVIFAPAYFPFTEPSVEAFVKHPDLGWIELGGAGIFRPEVTAPFGIDVPVLAWGMGLDRMAMVALGIKDIRDLFSRDLEKVRGQRLDLELT